MGWGGDEEGKRGRLVGGKKCSWKVGGKNSTRAGKRVRNPYLREVDTGGADRRKVGFQAVHCGLEQTRIEM